MRPDQIRELLRREPFQPFKVVMTSGAAYPVTNPDFVVPMKSELFIAMDDGEHWTFCPYLHISSVQTIPHRRPPQSA